MPPVGAAVASWFAGMTFGKFMALAATAWAISMSGVGKKKPSISKLDDKGRLINTRSTSEIYPIIYGKTRIGGNLVFATTTGTDNKYLHMILSLGEGEVNQIAQVDSIDQIFLNDKLYTESDFADNFYYEFFSGSSTQNVCATLHTAYPAWTDAKRYSAYLYCRLEYDRDKFVSIPSITAILEGLKVKNFATEDDYDSMPMAYTNNLAYCVYDLLTRRSVRGGKEIDPTRIDLPSFRDAATYYDTYGWTCNMSIDRDQSIEDNIAMLLANGRSEIIYSDSKFKLKFRDTREESVCMQITEDDIIQYGKESTIEIAPAATLFSRPNAIKATFISADKNYHQDEKIFQDDDAYSDEGDYRELAIELLGLSSLDKVIPMSYYCLERARWGNVVNMVVGNKGISLELMDLIEITHRMPGWTDAVKPMYRVEGAQLQEDGNVALVLLQEHDDLYNDDYDIDTQELFVTDLPEPGAAVYGVINASHAEEVYYYRNRSFTRWKIDFDPPAISDYPFWDYAEIWLKIGSGDYKFMTKATSDYQLDPVEEGETYYIKIRSVSIFGAKEDFDSAYVVSKQIVGKTDVPSNMFAITAVASGDTVNVYGDEVDNPDISGYELRIGSAWLGGVFIAFNETPNFRLTGVKPGTLTFWCCPKDNSGNYAVTPVSAICTTFYPSGYTDKNTWSWDYNGIGTHDNTEYELYGGDDCLKCSHGAVILDENCSDISDWVDGDNINGVSQVNPAGQFEFHTHTAAASNYASRNRDIGNMPDKATFEIKIKHFALGSTANNDHFAICISNATTVLAWQLGSNGCFIYNGSWQEIGTDLVSHNLEDTFYCGTWNNSQDECIHGNRPIIDDYIYFVTKDFGAAVPATNYHIWKVNVDDFTDYSSANLPYADHGFPSDLFYSEITNKLYIVYAGEIGTRITEVCPNTLVCDDVVTDMPTPVENSSIWIDEGDQQLYVIGYHAGKTVIYQYNMDGWLLANTFSEVPSAGHSITTDDDYVYATTAQYSANTTVWRLSKDTLEKVSLNGDGGIHTYDAGDVIGGSHCSRIHDGYLWFGLHGEAGGEGVSGGIVRIDVNNLTSYTKIELPDYNGAVYGTTYYDGYLWFTVGTAKNGIESVAKVNPCTLNVEIVQTGDEYFYMQGPVTFDSLGRMYLSYMPDFFDEHERYAGYLVRKAEFQTWRFLINYLTNTLDIYLYDSSHAYEKVATAQAFTSFFVPTDGKIDFWQFGYTTNDMVSYVDYIKLQAGLIPADSSLTGTWISPEYDLGSEKTVRVWADFLTVFVSSAASWEGIFPGITTWAAKTDANTRWYELTTPDIAAILEAKIKWGVSPGVYLNEADFFQILAPEFTARYIQVEIKITDPQADANLYIKELNLKAAYWS